MIAKFGDDFPQKNILRNHYSSDARLPMNVRLEYAYNYFHLSSPSQVILHIYVEGFHFLILRKRQLSGTNIAFNKGILLQSFSE